MGQGELHPIEGLDMPSIQAVNADEDLSKIRAGFAVSPVTGEGTRSFLLVKPTVLEIET